MVLKSQKCDLHILTRFYPEKERKNENNPKRYFKEKPRKTSLCMLMPLASKQGNAIVLMKTSFLNPCHSPVLSQAITPCKERKTSVLYTEKPYQYITPQNALRDFSFSRVITINYSFTSLYSSPFGEVGRGLYYRLISFALIAHWCISTSFSKIKYENRTCEEA